MINRRSAATTVVTTQWQKHDARATAFVMCQRWAAAATRSWRRNEGFYGGLIVIAVTMIHVWSRRRMRWLEPPPSHGVMKPPSSDGAINWRSRGEGGGGGEKRRGMQHAPSSDVIGATMLKWCDGAAIVGWCDWSRRRMMWLEPPPSHGAMKPPSSDGAINWRSRGEGRGGGEKRRGMQHDDRCAWSCQWGVLAWAWSISLAVMFISFENRFQGVYIFAN